MKLFNKAGTLKLELNTGKEINSGGEGAIYLSPNSTKEVIKIYHQHTQSTINEAFLKDLSVLNDTFIKPLDLYYTSNGRVAGFPMKYLDTNKLHLLTDLSNKAICLKEGYDEKLKITVLTNIVESIRHAHSNGVVIGDLNPYNIFFSKKGEVFFIDTDSYQTKSKKHSGTMLPDIRDWLTHEINDKTDYFSLAVISFHATTYLHPYKGIHSTLKTLEERVVKHASVLNPDPDLKLPGFYQPIATKPVLDQFAEIFNLDKRYPIDLHGVHVAQAIQPARNVTVTDSKLLSVRVISDHVTSFDSEGFYLTFKKDNDTIGNILHIVELPAHGTIKDIKPIRMFKDEEGFWVFNSCIIIRNDYGLHITTMYSAEIMRNFNINDDQFTFRSSSCLVVFDSVYGTCTVMDTTKIAGNSIYSERTPIFVPSVAVKSGCAIQSIGGKKWLLLIVNGNITTLRTDHDIRDAYSVDDYFCLQVKVGAVMKYYLAKRNGMKVELGTELSGMRSFAVLGGNNLFVPEDGQVGVYSGVSLVKIAEVECKYVNEQSVLKSSTAGIVCQTGSTLYLFNKN